MATSLRLSDSIKATELTPADPDWLESKLCSLIDKATACWPGVELDRAGFVEYLSFRLPKDKFTKEDLEVLQVSDLYLSYGCVQNNCVALNHLNEKVIGDLSDVLSRFDESSAFCDEIGQLLRQKLLLSNNGNVPKISEYSGKGPLRKWVRMAALRMAISLRRNEKPEVAFEEALTEIPSSDNAELKLLRARHESEFKLAIQEAFKCLTAQERNILRLSFIEGLSLQQIGNFYGAHRTTVSSWITCTRQKIIDETRRILCERLRLGRPEFESLFAAIRSGMQASLVRLLTEKKKAGKTR